MINKISCFRKIGLFDDFKWDDSVSNFDKINIIYGYNGCGKTTISNAILLYSKFRDDERDTLFTGLSNDSEKAEVELVIDNRNKKYKKGLNSHEIWVFNSNFVADHVYNGTVCKIKEFDKDVITEEQLKDPKIKKLEDQIAQSKEQKEKLITRKENLEKKFDEIKNEVKKEFNKRIQGKRLPDWSIPHKSSDIQLEEVNSRLDEAYQQYKLCQQQDEFKKDLEDIENIQIKKIEVDIDKIFGILSKDLSADSKAKVEEKILQLKKFKPKNVLNLNEWFEDGHLLLKFINQQSKTKCPLCGSNIQQILQNLISDYDKYFNDEFKVLMDQIGKYSSDLEKAIEVINENDKELLKFENLANKYEHLFKKKIDTQSLPKPIDLEDFQEKLKKLKQELDKKKGDIHILNVDIELRKMLKKEVDIYENKLVNVNLERKRKILDFFKDQVLDEQKVISNIKQLTEKLAIADFDKYESGNKIVEYRNLVQKIERVESELIPLEKDLTSALIRLKNESRYVNTYLKRLGITHFEINIKPDNPSENMQVHYTNGCIKQGVKNSISEGEKTALAFAYFLSKIQYEIIDNENRKLSDSIIVIDDPVSSLDENRLFSTAYLIADIFRDSKQLFVMSHNLIFLKYFGNVIGHSNRQDYFLDIFRVKNPFKILPAGLTNYTTAYYQKLQDIISYAENEEIEYDQAKTFMANYIRTVLESFLSFKFFILKQGSSREKTKSAGLDKLIQVLNGKIGSFKGFQKVNNIDQNNVIEKLEFIKKTTDPQAHGTPQNIDNFNFISEQELKNLAKDTINIIKFFDQIHYDQVSQVQQN